MQELTLSLPKNKKPYYLKIAETIRQAIMAGQLRRNELLPPTRQLARTWKIHRHTVMAGLEELVAEGWLIANERKLFQVSSELPAKFFTAQLNQKNKNIILKPHHWRIVRSISDVRDKLTFLNGIKYNFQSGLADLSLFPHDEFRLFLSDAYKRSPVKMMGYGDPAGLPALIESIKIYLRRVRAISDREIIITHGSQEGIFHVGQLLLQANDFVAVERLGYPPAWDAFRSAGAKLIPVEIDDEGLIPESLEKILKQKKIRLIYVTPLHQYPTTVTLTVPRRMALYQLATQYGVPILEDDYDHEFHYRSQPLAPLASNDPAEKVIYVSTFSKILFPAARLGFIAAPKAIAEKLKQFKRITSRQNDTLLQQAVSSWMKDGGFERHLRRMRRIYEDRREAILACVEKYRHLGFNVSCEAPDGGMAIWLNINSDADKLMVAAAKQGIRVFSESFYSLNKNNPTHLRLGFANQNIQDIRAGMEMIFNLM